MDVERIINFDEVGDIIFKKSKKARRLTIKVRTHRDVNVSIPVHVSYRQAEAFVREKIDWIRKTQENLKEKAGELTLFNELTEFSTLKHDLQIERIEGDKILRKIAKGKILVSIPFTKEINSAEVQGKIRTAIIEAWRKEAREILPERLDKLANQYGFKYKSLSIKNMKTRWGSCSGINGINLNLHLVRLPEDLCDYIILHELVHTIHKNHGKNFWAGLDKLVGNAKLKAVELRKFRLEIW
jgi:predicted metal-dependent hydrolase